MIVAFPLLAEAASFGVDGCEQWEAGGSPDDYVKGG
jgi:hypothetical protein